MSKECQIRQASHGCADKMRAGQIAGMTNLSECQVVDAGALSVICIADVYPEVFP